MRVNHLLPKMIFILTGLLGGLLASAYEAADTDVNGQPLEAEHFVIDMSANGRYLLLADFDPSATMPPFTLPACTIWRKDRDTSELTLAFKSNKRFNYCAKARISADGRYVAAAPGQSIETKDYCEKPGAHIQALQTIDLETGDIRRVWTRLLKMREINSGSPCGGLGSLHYPAQDIYAYSGNGKVAIVGSLGVYGNTVGSTFELFDAETGMSETLAPDGSDTPSNSSIQSLALSHRGTRIAMAVRNGISGPSNVIACGQTGRCDRFDSPQAPGADLEPDALYNPYNKQVLDIYQNNNLGSDDCSSWWQCQPPAEPQTVSIHIFYRKDDVLRKPAKLHNLRGLVSLDSGGWSMKGKRLSWVEYPKQPLSQCFNNNQQEPECQNFGCAAEACELVTHTFFIQSRKLRSQATDFDPETLSGCFEYAPEPFASNYMGSGLNCSASLSRNGNYLLYPRSVRYPFNDGWQPDVLAIKDFVCIDRLTLETPNMEPEEVGCPAVYPESGPILGLHPWDTEAHYANPLLWHVRDVRSKKTQVVSATLGAGLFTSSNALISGNGSTLAFQTRDESASGRPVPFAENCRWSPANSPLSIALGTGDTTQTVAEEDFIVYPDMPQLCAVPEPARQSRVIAGKHGNYATD